MHSWNHSGFSVHHAVRLDEGDTAAVERLVHSMLRCPFSLQRLIKVTPEGKVVYLAEKRACRGFPKPASPDLFSDVPRNFQIFDPLDFIAELTQHIPDPRKHLIRYFGWYSHKARGLRAKANGEHQHAVQIDEDTPRPRHARRRWAALIKRVWQVDPLVCAKCGAAMKIVSFIEPPQRDVIERILRHCGLWQEPARGPPPDGSPAQGDPALGELRYVNDLEFVDEPHPSEPVWIAG